MNIAPTAVTHGTNLALFMVDVSKVLMCEYRQADPNFSVLDFKAYYRGYRYVMETIQILTQKPDDNLVECKPNSSNILTKSAKSLKMVG